ncbi:MAG TPA: hypothetical protein VEI81_00160, partial [Methanoregula sp.]|nr:hypothetical protein [Methanoregula sp.]
SGLMIALISFMMIPQQPVTLPFRGYRTARVPRNSARDPIMNGRIAQVPAAEEKYAGFADKSSGRRIFDRTAR